MIKIKKEGIVFDSKEESDSDVESEKRDVP